MGRWVGRVVVGRGVVELLAEVMEAGVAAEEEDSLTVPPTLEEEGGVEEVFLPGVGAVVPAWLPPSSRAPVGGGSVVTPAEEELFRAGGGAMVAGGGDRVAGGGARVAGAPLMGVPLTGVAGAEWVRVRRDRLSVLRRMTSVGFIVAETRTTTNSGVRGRGERQGSTLERRVPVGLTEAGVVRRTEEVR